MTKMEMNLEPNSDVDTLVKMQFFSSYNPGQKIWHLSVFQGFQP